MIICHILFVIFTGFYQVNFEKEFYCSRCGRTYKRKQHLQRHLNYECGVEPKFHCSFCPYRAKQKCTLDTHVFCKHTKVKLKL